MEVNFYNGNMVEGSGPYKPPYTFTDTSTRISRMVIAQSVAVMDRQHAFTDTSTRISSLIIALCL